MESIKVLVVDDSLTIRAIFEEILGQEPAFVCVGSVSNAEEAVGMVHKTLPDVVALDISMPGIGGIALLDMLKGFWHETAYVMVSSSATHDAPICTEAFEHGAFACFDKSHLVTDKRNLVRLLKEAAKGKASRAAHHSDGTTLPH